MAIGDQVLRPGQSGYLGRDRGEITVSATEPTRALLIGREPFAEPILMWWNFVARTR